MYKWIDVNKKTGQLPMHHACATAHVAFVEFLIKISILKHDLRVSDIEGYTGIICTYVYVHIHTFISMMYISTDTKCIYIQLGMLTNVCTDKIMKS